MTPPATRRRRDEVSRSTTLSLRGTNENGQASQAAAAVVGDLPVALVLFPAYISTVPNLRKTCLFVSFLRF